MPRNLISTFLRIVFSYLLEILLLTRNVSLKPLPRASHLCKRVTRFVCLCFVQVGQLRISFPVPEAQLAQSLNSKKIRVRFSVRVWGRVRMC